MNNIPAECIGYGDSNPDISGVGVRVSFYLQTFILVLLVDRSWQDAPIALWTFIATSAGLTLAAIIQRANLTLFQALVVSNLVWLANFGTFVALASYSRQKAASYKNANARRALDYKVKFGAMAQTLLSMALTLYVWVNAKTFGEQSQCSPFVKYVLFVFEVPALGSGRVVGLVVTSVLTIAYSVITLRELQSYYRSFFRRGENPEVIHTLSAAPLAPSVPSLPTPAPVSASSTLSSRQGYYPRTTHEPRLMNTVVLTQPYVNKPSLKGRPKRRRWSSDLDPMLVGIIICQAMVFTYFIVSIELLLKFNPSVDPSAGEWSIGQILALVVVMPSALSLIGAIKKYGVKRLSKRKKGRHRKRKVDIEAP